MKKEDILRRVGNPEQLISIRESVMSDGKARGSRVISVQNGKFSFTVLPDRGFDVADMRYKGVNLSFMTKNGIVSPSIAHTDAVSFVSSFTGGFLYTCGLDNIGGPENGKVLHGSQTMVPASCITVDKHWEGEEYVAKISAILENTALFGPNIAIKRTYTVKYMSDEVGITDEIENRGFLDHEYVMLYHFNFGYPLLDEGAEVVLDSESVIPRTEEAKQRMGDMYNVSAPVDVIPEFVYTHKLKGDYPTAKLVNKNLGLSIGLTFNSDALGWFSQWNSFASGDYALGLEPCTATLDGKEPKKIGAGKKIVNKITFKVDEI